MSVIGRIVGGALGVIVGVTGTSYADTPPSIWEIAKQPARRQAYELHVRVDRLLHPSAEGSELGQDVLRIRELRLEAAKTILEQGLRDGGEAAASLRIDLGLVLESLATLQGRPEAHGPVVDLLAPLADDPGAFGGDPAPLEALATAYAWLDRPREEVRAWTRYLECVSDDRRRISPLVNLGEAEMRLGDLDRAAAEFRLAIITCEQLAGAASLDAEYALALWDLGVVLDRSGDASAALQVVRRAKAWTWLELGPLGASNRVTGWDVIRDHVDVYFVPAWEREWYLAMGETADADAAPDDIATVHMWTAAEEHWQAYLSGAGAAGRWTATARIRLEHARARRIECEERLHNGLLRGTPQKRAQVGQ